MIDARYTIYPFTSPFAGLKLGDMIDACSGDTIIGPYCRWPKREPKHFIVTNVSETEMTVEGVKLKAGEEMKIPIDGGKLYRDRILKDLEQDIPRLTLEEYDKRILKPSMEWFTERQIANLFYNGMQWGEPAKPPTRIQKLKYRWQDYKQRAKDIWTILTGGDVHNDCGY